MTCRHCGSELPAGALFCGECGRAAPSDADSPSSAAGGEPAWVPDLLATRREIVFPTATQAVPDDAEAADADASAGAEAATGSAHPVASGDDPTVTRTIDPDAPSDDIEVTGDRTPDPHLGSDKTDLDAPPPPIVPVPGGAKASGSGTERFTLQFSTGEIVSVVGAGLIGRSPVPQPGEYVDQLVGLVDAGKSVSKTHLEFGEENGGFWVADRFSTNGTVLRLPDDPPRRCDPGKRYRIPRGTRVDLGEQFFLLV